MDYEIKYNETEKKYLCNFTIDTRIDDIDLPNKIKDKLNSLEVLPNPEKVYMLDVSFGIVIYQEEQFYNFPVERRQWQIDKLENLKQKNDLKQLKHTIIGEVLSQQIHNICNALGSLNINYRSATIAGEDFEEINRVDFCVYEDTSAIQEKSSDKPSKGKRKETKMVSSYSIIPHRPSMIKKLQKYLRKCFWKICRKRAEMFLHTPNLVSTDKIFAALATAILEPIHIKVLKKSNKYVIIQA